MYKLKGEKYNPFTYEWVELSYALTLNMSKRLKKIAKKETSQIVKHDESYPRVSLMA